MPILDWVYNARIPRPSSALLHPGGRKALALYRWGPGPGGWQGGDSLGSRVFGFKKFFEFILRRILKAHAL